MKKVLVVFGTRPEAIKMAPVVHALKNQQKIRTIVCVTAQHRSMLDQVLSIFDMVPDFDLNLMSSAQSLETISARILESMSGILDDTKPDLVLVHGDTTTTLMTSLSCFYKRIPVAHVEAGLRTHNIWSPWPEELNRRVTGLVAHLHFAPTHAAAQNLVQEGVDEATVEVTGNTVIDALLYVSRKIEMDNALSVSLINSFHFLQINKKLLLVTGHRRENFGDGMQEICLSLLDLSKRDDLQIVYAVHLNPNVKEPVEKLLGNVDNIYLIPPQDYLSFVFLMKKSYIILTDSGGIQEEAPSLGKPVLVMRDVTERPEAVNSGSAKLVGANRRNIVSSVIELIENSSSYELMANVNNPYGDGAASSRISAKVTNFLEGVS